MRIINKFFIHLVITLFFIAGHAVADDVGFYNLYTPKISYSHKHKGDNAWMGGYGRYSGKTLDGKYVVFCTGALEGWRNGYPKRMSSELGNPSDTRPDHGTYRYCADFLIHMKTHFECEDKHLCSPYSGDYPYDPNNVDDEFDEMGLTELTALCELGDPVCAGGWEAFTVELCPSTGSCAAPEDIEKEARQCEETGSEKCEEIEEAVGEPSCPAGNPINIGTGNKYQVEIEFTDRRGRLSFSKTYNSQLSQVSSNLGNGWTPLAHEAIYNSATKILQVELKDGKRLRFKRASDATFTALSDTQYTVVETVVSSKTSYVLTTPDNIQLVYNEPSGTSPSVLVEEIHADGYTKKYDYSRVNNLYLLDKITDSYEREINFTYKSPFSLLDKVEFPDGTSVQYTYNGTTKASQQLTKATYYNAVDSTTVNKQYLYGDSYNPHLLTGIIDEENQPFAKWAYDKYGRATSSEHGAAKEKISIDYSKRNEGIVTVTNSDAFETTHIFNDDGSIAHVINNTDDAPNCYTVDDSSMEYTDGALISVTESDVELDENNNITTINNAVKRSFIRNSKGFITEEVSPIDDSLETPVDYQLTVVTEWHDDFNIVKERTYSTYGSGLYRTETTTIDDNGFITSFTVTVPSGADRVRVTAYQYTFDASNPSQIEVLEITDPKGNTTIKTYNGDGLLAKVENALGHIITYSNYNDFGLPGSITNASGVETQYSYDPRGNMTEEKVINTAQGGEDIVKGYGYYKNNILKSITMPDAEKVITYVYDAARHLTSITETQSEGDHTKTYTNNAVNGVWDSMEIWDETNTLTFAKSRTFDEKGRLIVVEGNNNQIEETTIGAHDVISDIANGTRDAISFEYDLGGKLISKTLPNNATVYYEYHDTSELKKFTDANGVETLFNYNRFGELSYVSSVDQGVTTYLRDMNGNITNKKTYGRGSSAFSKIDLMNTDIEYDAINRPIKVTVDSNATPNVAWTYNLDRLEKVVDTSGETSFEYTALGELAKKSFAPAGASFTLATQYGYDKGRVSSRTYPSNNTYEYTYDYGNIKTIKQTGGSNTIPLADSIDYLPFTNTPKNITLADNITIETTHDTDGRVTEISSTAFDVAYGYDKYNNITLITKGSDVQEMTYDDHDQLLTQSGDTPIEIVYDDNGNRESHSIDFESDTFKYIYNLNEDSNRIGSEDLSINDEEDNTIKEYSYDVRGNVISQGGTKDAENGYQTIIDYSENNQIESVITDSIK